MNQRGHMQPYLSNSLAIRQEIQRFESVHPSIYAIYDLIEAIPDPLIQQQIREHVVCIEDSFVNSQEWTLARSVPDLKLVGISNSTELRLGILGTINSGKSALVHRYLTGSYMQEESPEGGRFKKEVVIDGQSYLLLIRDEGGPPEMQFTHWVDAVIFVFSLENEMSFNAIYSHYAKMAHYRNISEIPVILVGTQDAISESNPRVIDDSRARKLASDLKRCSYYETCATYGLNVERVFQDACQKITQLRAVSVTPTNSRPSTPNHSSMRGYYQQQGSGGKNYDSHSSSSQSTGSGNAATATATPSNSSHNIQGHSPPFRETLPHKEKGDKDHKHDKKHKDRSSGGDRDKDRERERHLMEGSYSMHRQHSGGYGGGAMPVAIPVPPEIPPPPTEPLPQQPTHHQQTQVLDFRDLPTPGSTPVPSRKNKKAMTSVQKSNSFSGSALLQRASQNGEQIQLPTPTSTPILSRKNKTNKSFISQKKGDEESSKKSKNGEVGSGRVIPVKQGYLYKKSSKPLNKDWKKKYVTLGDDGKLIYHPSLHDYMDDVHAKDINLLRTTVKIPGLRPRAVRTFVTAPPDPNQANGQLNNLSGKGKDELGYEGDGSMVIPNASLTPGMVNDFLGQIAPPPVPTNTPASKIETPNVKKRHRRAKSGAKTLDGQDGDSDGYEFVIVSLDNKKWHFEADSAEEREEWVQAIEQQILSSLQSNESNKSKSRSNTLTDPASGPAIRNVKGNTDCADCGSPNPDWASLNLGALICIECSGIHRNLGTHVSRVRSLDLDEWPPELVAVMTSIGNDMANSIWEASLKGRSKPTPNTAREEKDKFIRAKYEDKLFLPVPPYLDVPLPQQLIDAIARQDVHNTVLVLGHAKSLDINAPYSKTDTRTALHIAAALGNVVLVQLLLWYGANVKMVDHEGRNALWYARSSGSPECVELLRGQGCPENPTLPRRRVSGQPTGPPPPPPGQGGNDVFEKLPASVI